ncbi:MAG: hypothetical protein JXP34_07495 [Planctomycetes bacterium]|nr:hypothetical protein [Planctomycetota bacterium]
MRRLGSIVLLAGLIPHLEIGCTSQGSLRGAREADAEAEIWALEQAYWVANRAAEHDAIAPMWL